MRVRQLVVPSVDQVAMAANILVGHIQPFLEGLDLSNKQKWEYSLAFVWDAIESESTRIGVAVCGSPGREEIQGIIVLETPGGRLCYRHRKAFWRTLTKPITRHLRVFKLCGGRWISRHSKGVCVNFVAVSPASRKEAVIGCLLDWSDTIAQISGCDCLSVQGSILHSMRPLFESHGFEAKESVLWRGIGRRLGHPTLLLRHCSYL